MCKQMEHPGNISNVCCRCCKLDNISTRRLYSGHKFSKLLQRGSHFPIVIGDDDFCLRYNLVLFQCSYKVPCYLHNCDRRVKILVVLPVRYTKIPFFLEGKERERQKEREVRMLFSVWKTQPYYFTSVCWSHWQDKWREREQQQQQQQQQQQYSLGSQNGCKIPNWRVISYTIENLAIIEWVWKTVLRMMKLPAAQYQHNLHRAWQPVAEAFVSLFLHPHTLPLPILPCGQTFW